MTETEVIDKIHHLPAPVQRHLYLYVDFLYNAYSQTSSETKDSKPAENFFDEHELTGAGKEWLEKRAAQAVANPEKNKPWREVRDRVHKKHNLPQ
ncbi:MAG TPA: hypothetical protein ENJ95_17910 [Bacteroidetes bacterium]|nr:hypothetical protein [Bacteroidota bacterium]